MGSGATGTERVQGCSCQGSTTARGGCQGNQSSNGNQNQGESIVFSSFFTIS